MDRPAAVLVRQVKSVNRNLEARVGFEPATAIGHTLLTHFTLRPIRQKRPKRQSEVHGGYTEQFHSYRSHPRPKREWLRSNYTGEISSVALDIRTCF
jgi:hypothetical protein